VPPDRNSVSGLQAEALDQKGGVQLRVLPVGAETKYRIAVHVQEALQTFDHTPCLRRWQAEPLRKRHDRQAALGFVEGIERGTDCVVVRCTLGPRARVEQRRP